MNKENMQILNIVNIVSDCILVILAMLGAYVLRFLILAGTESMPLSFYIWSAASLSLLYALLFGSLGLYDSQRSSNLLRAFQRIFVVSLACTALLATVYFTSRKVDVSRWLLVFYFFLSTLLLIIKRMALYHLLRSARTKGRNTKYTLLIGSGANALDYLRSLKENPWLGYQVLGTVGVKPVSDTIPYLGGMDELDRVIHSAQVDEVVAALDLDEFPYMNQMVAVCEKCGLKFSLIPYFSSYMLANPHIDEVGSVPLINLRRIPLDNLVNAGIKRTVDIVGSLMLLILTSPLMLVAAVGTRLTLGKPVIYRQTRVGFHRKPFTMLKFRSMRQATNDDQSGWSCYEAARLTKFGAFLRRFSIDELPQLYNVLKGEMSLIGPRPELPKYVDMFRDSVPLYMVKHQVRPGISGLAQVRGYRGDTSIEARIHCDIAYIENWTILLDIKILILTLFHFMDNGEIKKHEKQIKQGHETVRAAKAKNTRAEAVQTERKKHKQKARSKRR